MAKIGLIANDYKLDTYKEELGLLKFTDYEISSHAHDISIIKVNVPEEILKEASYQIFTMCNRVEQYFQDLNDLTKNQSPS